MNKWVLGILFLASFSVLFSSQNAFAVSLFSDDFSSDPASNGWIENFVGGSGNIESHLDHGNELNLEKTINDGSQVFLTITREISTECFENIQINLEAHQRSSNYEPKDFLDISIDTNDDGMFESVLKDVEVWEGLNDPDTNAADTGDPGNSSPTSTGFVDLSMADNNPGLKIRIGANFNSLDEEYHLNFVEVTGDIIQNCGDAIGGDILEIDNYALLVTAIGINPIITSLFGLTLVGIGLVIARKKIFLGSQVK